MVKILAGVGMTAAQYRKQMGRQKGECTLCGGPIAKGRRLWCGQECADRYMMRASASHRRHAVRKRDKCVCQLCGCDTAKLGRLLGLVRYNDQDGYLIWRHLVDMLLGLGFNRPGCSASALWEADHIRPKCEGGEDELDNLRTLCIPCHKQETARLAARRADRRYRAERPLLVGEGYGR
jgi:5-methylcytosine-specific restriction enzyme A